MTQRLTGPALVAYLRDNPTSEAMRAAADEIVGLRYAVATAIVACRRVDRAVDGVDFPALRKGLADALGDSDD